MTQVPLNKHGPGGDYVTELWEGQVQPVQWEAIRRAAAWTALVLGMIWVVVLVFFGC